MEAPMKQTRFYLLIGTVLLMGIVFMASAFGAIPIQLNDMMNGVKNGIMGTVQDNLTQQVFFSLRLPRIILCGITGGALAVSGLVMQALTRNPIVEAGLTGTSAGAAFGASLVFVFAPLFPQFVQLVSINTLLPMMAFVGALLATIIVYKAASVQGVTSAITLLLVGVAVNALAFSGVGFLSYIARDPQARSITFWNLGGFSGANWMQVGISSIVVLTTIIYFFRNAIALDLLQLGEKDAGYLGLSVNKVRRNLLIANTILVATLTAWCGVIAFVGLTIPHIMRRFTSGKHQPLIGLCFIAGACLMLLADLAARTIISPAEVPVGILTALVGAPIFIIIIRKQYFS